MLQAHEYTCGAASLATIASLLGRQTTEREVLDLVFTDTFVLGMRKDGGFEYPLLSAADLERAARAMGLKAVSLRAVSGKDAIDALAKLRPIIARVYLYEEFQHFVIVRGVENGWVYISDPAYGNVRIPLDQFYEVWEKGDRVVLAYGLRPFLAWKTEDGALFVKRDPEESVPQPSEIAPVSLYKASARSITMSNSTFRQ